MGELHGPGNSARRSTIQLAIDEIGDASEHQAERRDDADAVANARPRYLVLAGVKVSKDRHSQKPSVTGHASFPNFENHQRIFG